MTDLVVEVWLCRAGGEGQEEHPTLVDSPRDYQVAAIAAGMQCSLASSVHAGWTGWRSAAPVRNTLGMHVTRDRD